MAGTDLTRIEGKSPEETPAPERVDPGTAPASPASLLLRLQSLQEMQAALQVEDLPDEILRVGVAASVEILGADCGIALLEELGSSPEIRCGWGEGHRLARHEIEILSRSLEPELGPLRKGKVAKVLLAAEPDRIDPGSAPAPREEAESAGEPPAALQSRQLGSVLAQAIGSGAGRRGVLILARRERAPFSRETVLLAELLANQIAVHLERARRTTEAHRATDRVQEEVESATRDLRTRNRELLALNAVAATATPSFDLDRQIEAALTKAVEATGHAAGGLYLLESDTAGAEMLRFARGIGSEAYLAWARARTGETEQGIAGRVRRTDLPLVLADLGADPSLTEGAALAASGYRGLLALPMRARGRTIGVMELLADTVRSYGGDEVNLAQAVADQVGFAVQNTRLFSDMMRYSLELEGRAEERTRDAEAKERQLRALLGVVETAALAAGSEALFESALARALDLCGAEVGAAHQFEPSSRLLRLRAQRGLPREVQDLIGLMKHGDPLIGRAADTGEMVTASELGEGMDGLEGALARAGLRSAVAIPLRSRRALHGVVTILAKQDPTLGQEERLFLIALGDLIGMAIEATRPAPAEPATVVAPRAAGGPDDANAAGDPARPAAIPARLVQSQKMESIGTLAGGIAHDFNNILGAIMGYASYIRSLVSADNPIYRQATTIEMQAQRAADLTQQLLAFARGGQYRLEPVDLNGTVAEIVSFLSKSVDRNITLEVHTEPDLPPIEADASQMKQVFLNVAVNAKEALPQGGRIIFETRVAHLDQDFVRAAPDLKPGDYVEIVIGDTGLGMPPEVVDRIFEPFFTTKPAGEGTGLGMAAVYGIVKNHHGHVAVSSTPGIGTTVRIYLPAGGRSAVRPAASAARRPATPAPKPPATGLPAKVSRKSAATPPSFPPFPEPSTVTSTASGPIAGVPIPAGPEAASGAAVAVPAGRMAAPAASQPTARAPVGGKEPPVTPARTAARSESVAPRRPAPVPVSGAEPPSEARLTGAPRILVVDDEEAIRDMIRDILLQRGYEVILARDGVEGLDLYRENWGRIDLVLLDMVMPRLGGLETFRRLLGMDRDARVLLCSGYSHNDPAQRAIKEGALGLLTKPYSMAELLAWVERTVGRPLEPGKSSRIRTV